MYHLLMEFFSSEKLVKWFALMVSILFHICLCNITFISLEERMMLVILFFWTFISVWIGEVGNRGAKSQVAIILTSREISNMPLTTDHAWPTWWISFRWNCSVSRQREYTVDRILKSYSMLKIAKSYIREFSVLRQRMLKSVCHRHWILEKYPGKEQ